MNKINDNVKADYKITEGIYLKDVFILGLITLGFYLISGIFLKGLRVPIIVGAFLLGFYFLSPSFLGMPFYSRFNMLYAFTKYTKNPIYYGSGESKRILTEAYMKEERMTNEGVIVSENIYSKILQVAPRDLYSLNEDDLFNLLRKMSSFYRNYEHDLKWLTLRFPSDYTDQKNHLKSLLLKSSEKRKEILQLKINELKTLETENQDLEYFIFFYGNSENDLEKNINQAKNLLDGELNIYEIGEEKTKIVLSKLYNQNTKI